MMIKRPLNVRRLRGAPPRGFGWIDHRLLREGYLSRSSPPALALYTFLVCAADNQGLSYYSLEGISTALTMEASSVICARGELIDLGLIAYQKPLYQLLALEAAAPKESLRQRPHSCPVADLKSQSALASTAPRSAPPSERPAPRGLDLRAMVKASLQKGSAQ
jgi:hypothetical protein